MLLRPSTLLLFLISALSVLASLGTNLKFEVVPDDLKEEGFGGGFWFEEVHKSPVPATDKDIQAKAMASKVKHAMYKTGVQAPPIVVALFIPGHGTIVATSIKPGEKKTSSQTCRTILWKHRNWANCAEPNSVSIAVREGWIAGPDDSKVPKGSKMAIYGQPSRKIAEGFQNPCADGLDIGDGCQRFLAEHPNIEVVNPVQKRAVAFAV